MRRQAEGDYPQAAQPLAPYAPPVYTVPGGGSYGPPPTGGLPPVPGMGLPTFMGLLNALKRRWVLATFLGLLAAMAGAAGVWLALPTGKHRVRALVEVQPARYGLQREYASDENFENFKKNQETLIKTRTLTSKVAKAKGVADLAFIKNNDDPAKWIEDKINIKWEAPDIMAVSFNGDNPEQLRIVLDALVKKYIEESKVNQQIERTDRRKRLVKTAAEYEIKIRDRNNIISGISKLLAVTPAPEATSATIDRLNQELAGRETGIRDSETQLRSIQIKEKSLTSQLEAIATQPIEDADLYRELDKDANVMALKKELDAARKAYADAAEKSTNINSEFVVSKRKTKDNLEKDYENVKELNRGNYEKVVRATKRQAVDTQLAKLRDEKLIYEDRVRNDKELVEDLKGKLNRVAESGVTVMLEMSQLKPLQDQYAKIQQQLNELDAESTAGRIHEREEAQVIMNFNLSQKTMFSAAVGLIAFVTFMVLVAYLEWRSRRVDSVDMVVNELGMRIIGTIPAFPSRASLKAGEADQNQNWRFILNESVNSTRTMLLHTAKTQSMQVIMVTSAMQGEGKTSLASQLGTSMATAGLRTLILDCDLRNPSMHRLFDVQLAPGCSEILCQEVDVSDAVQPTTVPNLWMIPAGLCSNRVIAALAQGHPLETLFNRLRGQFDFIVVDSCPVLPVADSLLVGQHVDGVVLSILQDVSQLPKVLNASERLTQLGIPLLGAVVNGVKTDIHAYGYNYVKQLPA